MSEAPNTIWATAWNGETAQGKWSASDTRCFYGPSVKRYVRDDLVNALVEAVRAERMAREAFEAMPADRGGSTGPKGMARKAWLDARYAVGAAVSAIERGQGDE